MRSKYSKGKKPAIAKRHLSRDEKRIAHKALRRENRHAQSRD